MAKLLTNELKTGFLVVLSIAILMGFTLSVGKFSVFQKQYKLYVVFDRVAGVESDAPVRLSGVEVGKVENIELSYKGDETKVKIGILLYKNAKPRQDSKAYVTTLGLMGEKYIELSSGSKGSPFLKPGSTIIGEDPVQMEELVEIGKKVASEVEDTLGQIRSLAQHLDELVVDNRGNIDSIIGNLDRTTENFEEFSDDIKRNPWKLLIKAKEK
jgi:phospholipid/cholesterol/gamma-HCH transport system substrate-binding protein